MSVAIGDILAVGQLAFALYRQCYLVARGAPQDFQLLLADLTTLSSSIQLLQDELKDPTSVLVRSGEDRLRMIQEMIKRVEATLLELEKFATKYAKLLDTSRSKTRRAWDKIKWSTDLADIDALRNKLVYHNGVIHLLLTAAGNSSLQRLETSTLKIERRLTSIRELINKSQATHEQPTLSGRVINTETNLLKFELSATLMRHAESATPWKAIGIQEWINAGRWWLLKYQLQVPIDLAKGNVISNTVYTCLIKASWILSDVITKHPQLNLLEAAVQYDVQGLAEAIEEEFRKIDSENLCTPPLARLDHSELYIWEAQATKTQNTLRGTVGGSSSATASVMPNTGAFDLALQRFAFYEHSTGLRVPCCVQVFVHQHEKLIRVQIYDQNWKLHTEMDVNPKTRSTIYSTDEAIIINGLRVILGADQGILLYLLLLALVEYVWWYRSQNEPNWMKNCYTKLFSIIFAAAIGYMQFVEAPTDIDHLFCSGSYLGNFSASQFDLVEGARTSLQSYVKRQGWRSEEMRWKHRMQVQLNEKDEAVLPWMAKTRVSDWDAIQLCYSQIHPLGQDPNGGRNPIEEELRERTMTQWTIYTSCPSDSSLFPFGYGIGCMFLACGNGNRAAAKRAFLDLLNVDATGENGLWRHKLVSKHELKLILHGAFVAAASTGEEEMLRILVNVDLVHVLESGNAALQLASQGGYEAIVKLLLDKGADVNAVASNNGRTPLQAASEGGHEAIVRLLLDKGADVNAAAARNYSGRTALQAASEGGHETIVRLLLEKGADVNAVAARYSAGCTGRTALQAASGGGHEATVGLLLHKGADVNAPASNNNGRTALQAASEAGHQTIVRLLLDKGADVNAAAASDGGRTALQAASEAGHEAIVRLLLDKVADVNAVAADHSGRTALQAASSSEAGHEAIVRLLLDKGADVNAAAADHSGRTALQAASEKGHEAIVNLLLDKGADVDAAASDHSGRTALQAASEAGHEAIVRLLLDKGADINAAASDRSGRTALQAASEGGHETIVRLLLDNGADVNAAAANRSGRTALQAASKPGHETIVRLLLDKGADINAAASDVYAGRTALQAASEGGHEVIVGLLLDKGADVNAAAARHKGRTALQAASEAGHEAIVRLLLDKGANVNAEGTVGYGITALQAASQGGHEAIVRLLLDKGADAKLAGGDGITALQAASEAGHETIVRLLLDKGADINAVASVYYSGRTALQAASEAGNEAIVRLLLDNGADVNAERTGGYEMAALQAASQGGHEAIVRLLLDKGANVNAAAAMYGGRTALQAASAGGHEAIVRLLLDKGADVSRKGASFFGQPWKLPLKEGMNGS